MCYFTHPLELIGKIFLLRTVPPNSKVFLRAFLNMQGKQILTSIIEIQKGKLGVTTHFSKIINQQYL